MRTRSEIKAGAVMLAAVALGCVILVATGHWRGFFAKKQTLHVLFSDVQGLKIDDPVHVMGLELGKVTNIEVTHFTDEAGLRAPAVEVTAGMTYPEAFPRDTRVAVDRTLTGISVLTVEPGRALLKLAPGEKVRGAEPVSLKELANKAGSITQRLDDFVAVMANKDMSGAARSAMLNLKDTSELAKSVMASLNRSIPATEHGIVASVNNLEQFSGTVAGSKDRIADAVAKLQSASDSMARAGDNADVIMARSREPLIHMFANADSASSNLKSLTRQVRWQPWLLLKKPGKAAEYDRAVYNAALDFSEGAASLNDAVKELVAFMDANKTNTAVAGADPEKFKTLVEQVHGNLEKSVALETKLWQDLKEKGAKE